MSQHKTHWIQALILSALCATTSLAAPPDLTAPGVIDAVKADTSDPPLYGVFYRYSYNLGATGLRGWIWIDRSNKGDTGLITDPSRQILVTHAASPANNVLAVDDVILGAIAASSGTVPDFNSDCRKAFANAITEAEKTGAGTLRVKRWRNSVITEQNITISTLDSYSATAPFNCPKSALILNNVRNKMVADLLANPNYLTDGFGGASNAIALLSGVKDGDPNYADVQTRLQTFARAQAAKGAVNNGLPIWDWSYMLIFLSEYYLLTNDAQVVTGIQDFTLTLAEAQSIYGTYGHGPSAFRTDGSGRRVSTGYGPVNAVGGTAMIALALGKKALLAAGQAIAPQIDAAIDRSAGFFAFYVNKGSVPYGEHEPVANNHGSNGKDAMPAVFFGLQPNRAAETEYFSRISIAGWIGREYGHTGQGLSYYWTTLGALMGGQDAASEHLRQVRWHLDLSRRTDGSFAYDGQEQYGPGTTTGNTYLGAADYGGMTANSMYLLTYSMPLQRLYITGKNANPAYTLDSTKIADSVAAGSFQIQRTSKSVSELFTALGSYHPVVRNYAAIELASRSPSGADLTNLRSLLTSLDPNLRGSACHTLGLLQDTTALPTIVTLLNDSDIWVRAKAAVAIRAYPSATASTHRDAMMTSFITNATNPDAINWTDPIQTGNGKLSLAIFGNAVGDGTPGNDIAAYTINSDKQNLLYPALRAGLKQPDSYPRLGAARFSRENLSLADTQAIYPDVEHAAAYDTPADRMWSNDCRDEAITLMANLKIADGIPLALSMLNVPYDFEWGSETSKIAALNGLASYGDAARYTLPTLKGYLTLWNPARAEYPVLVSTIEAIENATTAATQALGLCVANSQVVTTTGTKAITLSGDSPRGAFSYLNVTQPAHGTLTGTAPNLTYTPTGGYTGLDQFTFQTTDTLTTSTVATVGIIVGPSGNGLKGEYFNNANFTSPVLTRVDPQINFDWGANSPHASVGPDTFSVRWSGVLLVPQSGNYTFSALTSDGVRLYLNGQLVIDRFVDQSTRWTDSSPVYLTAGQYAEVYAEYYENTGDAVAKLKWIGPGFAGANGNFIPQAYLFDGSGISNRTAYAFPQSLSTNLNTPLPILLNGSGGTLSYTVLTQPANGALSGTAPNLTYTPNNNFSGTDSFTFLVHNGTANSLPATVSISVQAGALSSFTWASAVSGNWSDGSKWTPSLPAAAGQPNYALNFTTAGTYTATHNLNNGFQLNQLNTAAKVTLAGTQGVAFAANGGALPQLNQNGADEVRVDHPISLQSMTTLGGSGGGTVILNGLISGAGGIVKTSPATLRIAQNNSYSGGTTIHSGTLIMDTQKDSALGSGPITLNGGTLEAQRINASNPLIANGGRLWGDGGWGGSWNGPVTLHGNLTVFTPSYDRIFLNGNISGTGGLVAEGDTSSYNSGNGVFLAGTNTYTGKTAVTSGMWLHCSNTASLGSGAVEISGGAKLDLIFTGNKTVASLTLDGATMPPGTYGSTTSPATNKNDIHFSGNGTLTILPPTTTSLNLTTGSSPANPGTSLTFTATVSGTTPTGNVQFYSGTTLLGSSALNGSYQATFTTTQLTIGLHSITAQYAGNASNSPSTSSPVAVEINNATTAAPTSLNASPADPNINLNWIASPGATSYYVKRSTTNGGPYTVLAMVSATTYQDSSPLVGVPYYYVVSALNAAGESPNSNQADTYIGSLTATTTTLASTPVAAGVYGSSVTFTATVTSSSGTPTGTVTFRSGSNVIGTGSVNAGIATLVLSTLSATTHSITASYEGSHDPSTSSPLSYQVTQKPLTITGVTSANKVYNGTTAATLSGGTLNGVIGGDTVTLIPGIGTFANANVGTWAVTAASYSLGGSHAANYTLSAQPTVPNATITARPIHITGTKTYDATTAAPNNILTIANNVDGGNLSLVGNAELSSKDAGNRTLIAGTSTITRIQTATAGTTANNGNTTSITATLASAPTNGNTLIAVISTRNTTTNQVSGIAGGGVTWSRVSQAANTGGSTTEIWYGPNVSSGGTSITISHAGNRSSAVVMEYRGLFVPASFDVAANNTGTSTAATTGATASTSQANQLWIGGIGAANGSPTISSLLNSFSNAREAASTGGNATGNTKVFALERIATTTGTASTGGTLSASLAWSGAIATFKGGAALSLTGSAAANYTLTGMTSSVTVNTKALTVNGLTASDKTYDGTTSASLSGTPALLAPQSPGAGTTTDGKPYSGDDISISGSPTGGSFASKHIGTNKPVTGVTGLSPSGAQSGNYTLVPVGTLTAHISALPVTVTAVNETKTYDGTTNSSGTPTLTSALASGDTTTVLSQSYQTKHAGTSNRTIIPAITIDDGNSGNNYTITLTNFTTGTINPLAITVAAVNATKTYDGTTTAPGTPTITPALAPGDTTSVLSQSFATATAGISNKLIIPAITINDSNSGNNYNVNLVDSTTGTINKANATVTLGSLNQTYVGTERIVSVTTSPIGLANTVTYDGSASEPINAGTYAAVATVNDTNYAGSNSGSLVISKASQTITFAALDPVLDNAAPFALEATASSNLTVAYASSNPGVATVSGNTVTIVGVGSTTITASQAGDANYNPATSVPQTLTVARANPLAVTSGPYSMLIGQSLSLNGSGSHPSNGETLSSYEWDLNNDNTFGDVTGATPTAIPYATLTTTWGRIPGINTIQLKVTDSAGKTSIVSTTLTLIDSFTWDANAANANQTDGTGAWLNANQWWTGSANTTWASGAHAVFGNGGTGNTVTLASPTSVNSITFNTFTGTYTLGSAGQTLTIQSGITAHATSGAVTITSPTTLSANQTWTNNTTNGALQLLVNGAVNNNGFDLTIDGSSVAPTRETANVRIAGALSGAGGLIKTGPGVLWLQGTASHGGTTTVNGGILRNQINSLSGLPSGNITLNGGVLESYWTDTFTRSLGSSANQIRLVGGSSGFSVHGGTSLTVKLNNDASTPIQWGSANFNPSSLVLQSEYGAGSAHTILQNNLDLNGSNRTCEVNGNAALNARATISGIISNTTGTAGLVKTGNGLLILTANNNYNGNTTVNAGTLRIDIANTNNQASTVSIAAGATLHLGFTGTDTVDKLFIDGTQQAAGVYKAPGSAASGTELAQLAGTGTLTVTSSPPPPGPGPVHHFVLSPIASPQTVGTPINGITITARDASNATATSFTGTVTFSGTAGITGTSANFTDGVLTGISLTPTLIGTDRTLIADDGSGHTGQATFTVQSRFNSWASTNSLTYDDAASTANPDGDSLNNLQEFAFGMNPTSPTLAPLTYTVGGTANPGLPILENTGTTQSPIYRAVFARRTDYLSAGLTYTVEFSANLTYWKSYATNHLPPIPETSPTSVDAVAIPFPAEVPISDEVESAKAPPKFFRVAVTGN